ncbi:MAG: hypothetical protein ABIQ73_13870 [Acidimicrobiales bacterium]
MERPGFSVRAVSATWDFTVFAVKGSRTVYLKVPRRELPVFLADLRAGCLDGWLRRAFRAPHQGRVLRSHAQALERAVFDEVDPAATLTAPERDRHGRPAVARVSTAVIEETASRVGKSVAYVSPQSFVPGDGRRNWLWLLVAVLAVLLVGGVAVALAGGGDDTTVATATTQVATSSSGVVASPATAPLATSASTAPAPLPSVVIRTTFVFPVTTYTVVIDGAGAPPFTYAWRMIGTETPECAARLLVEGPDDRSVTWDHPHPPCAVGTDHAGTVIEAVGTSATMRFTCRFQGAAESLQPCSVTRL